MTMRLAKIVSRFHRPGWSVVDQSFVSAVNFLSILLLARAMQPVEFGVLMIAYTGLMALYGLQQAFIVQPLNYIGAPLPQPEFVRFNAMVALMQFVFSSGLSLLLAISGALVFAIGLPDSGTVVIALAVIALPWLTQQFIRHAFYTRGRVKSAALNNAVCYGMQLGGIVWITLFAADPTPVAALSIYGASSLVAALFGAFQMRHWLDFSGDGKLLSRFAPTIRRVWSFGKWLVAQNMVSWFGRIGDTWVIGGVLGAEAVGIYRAVVHLAGLLHPLRNAALAYLPASASRTLHAGGRRALRRWSRRVFLALLLLVLPVALMLILFPASILKLAYGDKLSGYGAVLVIAVLAIVVDFVRMPLGTAILAMGYSRTMFKIHLIPVVLLPTLGVLLVWNFGVFGVPWFHLVSACAMLAAVLWVYRRHINSKPVMPATDESSVELQPSK